jgi:hypothetical protein
MGDWMKPIWSSGARTSAPYWYVSFIIRSPKLIIPQYVQGKVFFMSRAQSERQGLYSTLCEICSQAVSEVERQLEVQRTADAAAERQREEDARAAAELEAQHAAQREADAARKRHEQEEFSRLEAERLEVEAEVQEAQHPIAEEERELEGLLDIQMEVAEDAEDADDDNNNNNAADNDNNDDDEDDDDNEGDNDDDDDNDEIVETGNSDNNNDDDDDDDNDDDNDNDNDNDNDTNGRKSLPEQQAVSNVPSIHVCILCSHHTTMLAAFQEKSKGGTGERGTREGSTDDASDGMSPIF